MCVCHQQEVFLRTLLWQPAVVLAGFVSTFDVKHLCCPGVSTSEYNLSAQRTSAAFSSSELLHTDVEGH